IYQSRALGTRHLVRGIRRLPQEKRPSVLVSASAVGFYGDRGEEWLPESAPPGEGFLSEVCQDWENEIFLPSLTGVRRVVFRLGIVLGPDGGILQKLLPAFRLGLGGVLGSGKQWISWIHLEDVLAFFHRVLKDSDLQGVYNAVSPEPVTNADWTQALGRVLKRPTPMHVPRWALQGVMGDASSLLLMSQRAAPERLKEIGFRWKYPRLEEALAASFQ